MAGIDYARLCRAADYSRQVMQFYREERMRAVRLYAGDRYHQNAAKKKRYVNFIDLYHDIVGRNLFSANPRVSMSTFDQEQKAAVDAMEKWVNEETVRMDFATTMRRIVSDALFSVGIGYCALASPSDAARFGWGFGAGDPIFCRIDPDDWVFDTVANDLSEADFQGHRVTVDLETILDSKLYKTRGRDKLAARTEWAYNREGDERIGMIGRSLHGFDEGFKDKVDLWHFYLPKEKLICVFTEDDLSGPSSFNGRAEPLRVDKWVGPDAGPYHILAYKLIPGNPFPKGPIQNIVNIDEALNESYRKLVRQAANQKDVTVCGMNNTEDGERIKKSSDLDVLPLNDPKSVQAVSMNGVNQGQFLFMQELFNRASTVSGNLLTMGGLAPQAGTLGQEELLAQQSNGQVAAMQELTYAFVQNALGEKGMGWFWWYSPNKVMKTSYDRLNLPGVEFTRQVVPWDNTDPRSLPRLGEMPKLRVDPYSLRYQTPQQKANAVIDLLTKIYAPLAQVFQQAGVVPDLQSAMVLLAKYFDNPDMQTIFTISEPPTEEPATGASHARSMPTETTRNYNRRSLGNQSSQAQDAMMETELEGMGDMSGQLQTA